MLTYTYRARTGAQILAIILAIAFISFAIYAIANRYALRLFRGTINFNPQVSMWIFIAIAVLMAWLGVRAVMTLMAGARQITITQSTLTMPKAEYSKQMVELTPQQIQGIKVNNPGKKNSNLQLTYTGGKILVGRTHFEHPSQFDEFTHALQQFAHPTVAPSAPQPPTGDAQPPAPQPPAQ